MSRQRRRRVQGDSLDCGRKKDELTEQFGKERESKVMFMEEVDYKMEIDKSSEDTKRILVKN